MSLIQSAQLENNQVGRGFNFALKFNMKQIMKNTKSIAYQTILLSLCQFNPANGHSPPVQSSIDTRTGAYVLKWTIDGIPIQLDYNSRDVRVGLFGAGWCTDLDRSIEIIPGGDILYRDCSTAIGRKLTRRLKSGTSPRWQNSTASESDWIEKTGLYFYHRSPQRLLERYNLSGYLLELAHGESKVLINRNQLGEIIALNFSGSPPLTTHQTNNRLDEFFSDPQRKFKFSYEHNNLTSAQLITPVKTEIIFSALYDDGHNLTQLKQKDQAPERNPAHLSSVSPLEKYLTETIDYDLFSDRVAAIDTEGRCKTHLSYGQTDQNIDSKVTTLTTTVRQLCKGSKPVTSKFEYSYSPSLGSAQILKSARIASPTENNVYTFESNTGLPVKRRPEFVFQP